MMEGDAEIEQDNFFASLQQFLTSLEPAIKEAGSVAAAEDILTHLESTDKNFHRYDFVHQLRSRIEKSLGPLMDRELERRSSEGDGQSLVPLITEEILASREYANLSQSIITGIKAAVNALIQTFASQDPRQRNSLFDFDVCENKAKTQLLKISMDSLDEDSSLASSFGQVGYMFMSHEKFKDIAQELSPSQPLEVRFKALGVLDQFPQSDAISSEDWAGIRKGLLFALSDDEQELAEKALKFHARVFLTSSAHVTREIYCCLVEHISQHFRKGNRDQVAIEKGLNVTDIPKNQQLLKRFRLLNEFHHEIPSYWIRYPERFLEDILENSFNLISMSTAPPPESADPPFMSPLHYMALVDPRASWFKKWMHGNYSRTEVVKQLKAHPHLLTDAVWQCMEFSGTCKTLSLILDLLDVSEGQSGDKGLSYSGQDLEFLYFVHSLCLLGRLILYSDGRALFPVKLADREDPVTITELLVAFIRIMCTPMAEIDFDPEYHPGYLVCNVLKNIAASTAASRVCLCKDAITTALLSPVQSWLDGLLGLDGNEPTSIDTTLLLIADVLATLSVTETGRLQLLYGETQERWQRTRFSPARTIAEFAKKALLEKLPVCSPSHGVTSGFVFVCRQLYNTCEGLNVLNPYGLHYCLAEAWKKACAMPAIEEEPEYEESAPVTPPTPDLDMWEGSLIDNLLNFAGTPKGLQLLQQTGRMDEGVAFMYQRYSKKLQVSKCEKFGYGVMATQIAATAPGMKALENRGFIKRLVQDVWGVMEGLQDRRLLPPRIKHVDTIDSRTYTKALNNLLSVLSAFPAVYELLAEPNPERTSTPVSELEQPITFSSPCSVKDLVDRLIIIDSESKFQSLFNFEQSHHFGLRVLSVLCSCLDTFLLLQSQYSFQELLLQSQADEKLDNGKDYILDTCSVERNYILVKTYILGGENERILPGRTLTENVTSPYPWPLFSTYPPPREYHHPPEQQKSTAASTGEEGRLQEFLEGSTEAQPDSAVWLKDCKDAFCETVKKSQHRLSEKVVPLLLAKISNILTQVPEESIFPLIEYSVSESSLKNINLTEREVLGVKLVVRYGIQQKILSSTTEGTEDLTHLLKYCKFFFQGQQRVLAESSLLLASTHCIDNLSADYPGHDWFVSTVFLMMGGDPDESWDFLFKFSSLVSSGYLWVRRLHASLVNVKEVANKLKEKPDSTPVVVVRLRKVEVDIKELILRKLKFRKIRKEEKIETEKENTEPMIKTDTEVELEKHKDTDKDKDRPVECSVSATVEGSDQPEEMKVHLPVSLTVSGIPPLYSCTCHNVELILQAEVPLVYSAFRMSGYTPSQICQHWLRQCFWNYLNWEDICLYVCTCLTMGLDYQVYFCIAVLRHLQQEILRHTQQQNLLIFLKEEPIRKFRTGDYLDFMQELEKRYRPTILSDLQNITKP